MEHNNNAVMDNNAVRAWSLPIHGLDINPFYFIMPLKGRRGENTDLRVVHCCNSKKKRILVNGSNLF